MTLACLCCSLARKRRAHLACHRRRVGSVPALACPVRLGPAGYVVLRNCATGGGRDFIMSMTQFALLSLTDRLSMIIEGLYQSVAARSFRNAVPGLLILLVCRRVRRFEREVLALITAIREGRVRGGWSCLGRARVVRAEGLPVPAARLPNGFGWLCVLAPYKAAGFGSQLQFLLGDPEMVALLLASPRLVKLLRPVCRMLAIDASVLSPVVTSIAPLSSASISAPSSASEVPLVGDGLADEVACEFTDDVAEVAAEGSSVQPVGAGFRVVEFGSAGTEGESASGVLPGGFAFDGA